MITIRKAYPEDFDAIYPLLSEFNSLYLTKDRWEQLFVDRWNAEEGYFGYVMMDGDRAVGFLGLIFSKRIIKNKVHKFCNMTSWIVKKEYRGRSLFLLLPVLKLKTYTLTDFTPSREVYAILKKAGFQEFETHYRLIFPFPNISKLWSNCEVIFDKNIIEKKLNKKDYQIYRDNQFPHCHHLIIRSKYGECYLVMGRMVRKKFPFFIAQIYYINNLDVFRKCIGMIRFEVCFRIKVFAIYIDERFLGKKKILFSKKMFLKEPRLYRSDALSKEDMDSLYSESVIFNI